MLYVINHTCQYPNRKKTALDSGFALSFLVYPISQTSTLLHSSPSLRYTGGNTAPTLNREGGARDGIMALVYYDHIR